MACDHLTVVGVASWSRDFGGCGMYTTSIARLFFVVLLGSYPVQVGVS